MGGGSSRLQDVDYGSRPWSARTQTWPLEARILDDVPLFWRRLFPRSRISGSRPDPPDRVSTSNNSISWKESGSGKAECVLDTGLERPCSGELPVNQLTACGTTMADPPNRHRTDSHQYRQPPPRHAEPEFASHGLDLDETRCHRHRVTPNFGSAASNGAGAANFRLIPSLARPTRTKFWATVAQQSAGIGLTRL